MRFGKAPTDGTGRCGFSDVLNVHVFYLNFIRQDRSVRYSVKRCTVMIIGVDQKWEGGLELLKGGRGLKLPKVRRV